MTDRHGIEKVVPKAEGLYMYIVSFHNSYVGGSQFSSGSSNLGNVFKLVLFIMCNTSSDH
jgi:hypothetical protein